MENREKIIYYLLNKGNTKEALDELKKIKDREEFSEILDYICDREEDTN